MPKLSDLLIDVWSQVLVHDSEVVKLGSETFPVIRSKKMRFRQVYLSSMECRLPVLSRIRKQNPIGPRWREKG